MDRRQEEGLYAEGTEAKKGNCLIDYSAKPSRLFVTGHPWVSIS